MGGGNTREGRDNEKKKKKRDYTGDCRERREKIQRELWTSSQGKFQREFRRGGVRKKTARGVKIEGGKNDLKINGKKD